MNKPSAVNIDKRLGLTIGLVTCALVFSLVSSNPIQAHGGKKHDGETFTALQALQKATELYDRLIINGKLDETWETDLEKAEVTAREVSGPKEYRVGFHRRAGSPAAVFIFFSAEGQYSGSNFDGQW